MSTPARKPGRKPSPPRTVVNILKRTGGKMRAFDIEDTDKGPRFVLGKEEHFTSEDLMQAGGDSGAVEERQSAIVWLRAELKHGQKETKKLYEEFQKQGYGKNVWWKARKLLGVKVKREGTKSNQTTYLSLPSQNE